MNNFNTELDYLLSVLDNSFFKAQELLGTFSFNADSNQKVKLALGDNVDTAKAESILREFLKQDSPYLPKIEIRDKSEINGAKAAFAGENHTIYIAQEFLRENANNTDNIAAVLLEELGHAIDFQVNSVDTVGDEGELFSALVRGVNSSGYLVDLVLELWDANGTYRIDIEDDNDSYDNYEEIPLEDLPAGTYTVVIYDDYGGYYAGGYSFSYTLEINAPQLLPDQYESPIRNDISPYATVLNTASGYRSISNLSIDNPTDVDWFKFTTFCHWLDYPQEVITFK